MKIIKNIQILNHLKDITATPARLMPDSETAEKLWEEIAWIGDNLAPWEGLDHITVTTKTYTFHDIGCNGKDGTFRVQKSKEI